MTYWLNLFTGTTWDEFRRAGANLSGFREGNWARAKDIKPGDIFLCYMVGVSRWVGLLHIESERFRDSTRIFKEEVFPVRFKVRPIVMLDPEFGVPMNAVRGQVSFYPLDAKPSKWAGSVRNSPTRYKDADGDVIAGLIREAEATPTRREVDPKQLRRSANLYKLKTQAEGEEVERLVTVPSSDDDADGPSDHTATEERTHVEIQYRLLDLGCQMKLNIWAPRNDRGRSWNGHRIADLPTLLDALPTQFDPVTTKTIENIDVLWLSGNSIVAGFEVEHTSSIYSGLLRMSDLLTMQPNLELTFYLVAPDERQAKFRTEVARATFSSRKKPLYSVCRFLPYSRLCDHLERASDFIKFLSPDFLGEIAIAYDPESEDA